MVRNHESAPILLYGTFVYSIPTSIFEQFIVLNWGAKLCIHTTIIDVTIGIVIIIIAVIGITVIMILTAMITIIIDQDTGGD